MSVEAREWWERHATVRGAQWAVGMVLCGHASADGTGAYPSKAKIAAKACLDVRTVRHALQALEAGGWIRRGPIHEHYGTRIWALVMDADRFPAKAMPKVPRIDNPQGSLAPRGDASAGATASAPRGNGAITRGVSRPPEPSVLKPSEEPSGDARAGANGHHPDYDARIER